MEWIRAWQDWYSYLLILISSSIVACSSGTSSGLVNDENLERDSTIAEAKPHLFMAITFANTRIRTTPDLQGHIIDILPIDAVVEYKYDSTNFHTDIELQGEKLSYCWYKCRTQKGEDGWVYGGIIKFLEGSDNQRILAQFPEGFLTPEELKAREEDRNNLGYGNANQPAAKAEAIDIELLNTYTSFINKLDKKKIISVSEAIGKYELLFNGANTITCDAAFVEYHEFFEGVRKYQQEHLNLSKYQYLVADIERYGAANMSGNEEIRSLASNGFDFGAMDNSIYLRENADFTMRKFYRYVSPVFKEYLNQMQEEMLSAVHPNKELAISVNKVADRVIFWERIKEKSTLTDFSNTIEKRYHLYLDVLLIGTLETPSFSNGILQPKFKEAYSYVLDKYADTNTGSKIQEYYQMLSNQDFNDSESTRRLRQTWLKS